MAVKRQSIGERNAAAVAHVSDEPAAAPAPARMGAKAATAGSKTRVGTYWQHGTFQEAKSAYMVDLDLSPDAPNVFANWIGRTIEKHARQSPERRAKIVGALDAEPKEGAGVSRSFELYDAIIAQMDSAIVEDRRTLSIMENRTGFVSAAVRAAIDDVKKRSGLHTLPPAPARLPKNPPR